MKQELSKIYENRLKEKHKSAKSAVNQLNSSLSEFSKILLNIDDVYCGGKSGNPILICRSSLDKFYEEDNDYRDKLTTFAKTLFGEISNDEPLRSDKISVLARGIPSDSEHHRRLQVECRRLIEASRKGKETEISSHVSQMRAEAELEELRATLFRFKSAININPTMAINTPIVSEQEQRAIANRVHSLRAHIERIRRSEIPALLDDVGDGLLTRIEIAQLQLQEARHSFFIHRQKQLLGLLMKQLQWSTSLMMWHETERRSVKMMLRILHKLQAENDEVIPKMSQPKFCDLLDQEIPDVKRYAVKKAFHAIGKERIKDVPSDISRRMIKNELKQSKKVCTGLDEYMLQLAHLHNALRQDDSGSNLQLSYHKVREMLMEIDSHVKHLRENDSGASEMVDIAT